MKRSDGTFIVGIDLGTTYSLVSTVDAGRPVIIPNALGEGLTPSAVSVAEDGSLLVGAAARARAGRHPDRTALSFKRDMGTHLLRDLAGQHLSAIELSALVLGSLKRDAEEALGGPVGEAVITVPAYFGEAQRRATLEAARLAGLHTERLINEPTAAALAYGFGKRRGTSLVAVLDLGGGTFDVTVLRLLDGIIEIASSAGDTRLGGDDFTRALADLALARGLAEEGADEDDRELRAELFELAERAKRRLSVDTTIDLARQGKDGVTRRVTITRDDAEAAWAELRARLAAPIKQALRDARVTAEEVEEVLLVGGASRMPFFRALAQGVFGRAPLEAVPADEAVALGAAVQAALMVGDASVEDLVATDIAPFSLGIRTAERLRGRLLDELYTPILERGTVLPASRAKIFSTLHPQQTGIDVEVFQGEHSIALRNTPLGRMEVRDLPPGQFNAVEIRFTYDLNGVLEVEARSLATAAVTSAVFDRSGHTLDERQRAELRERFARLKLHPRELLPNRVALERAEELYVRLRDVEREALGRTLAHFRLALETATGIEAARAALTRLTAQLDAHGRAE